MTTKPKSYRTGCLSILAFGTLFLPSMPAQAQEKTAPATILVPYFSVFGAVAKPGAYYLKPGDRILDALDFAVPEPNADLSKVTVVHFDKAKRGTQQTINMNQFIRYGDIKGNPLVGYGDTLYVPKAKVKILRHRMIAGL